MLDTHNYLYADKKLSDSRNEQDYKLSILDRNLGSYYFHIRDETGDHVVIGNDVNDSDTSSGDDGNISDNEDLFHSEDDLQTSAKNLPWIFNYDKNIYSHGIAVQKLGGSDLSLLQWLAMNFTFFSDHPSISKQAFTDNLMLQKASWAHLQKENILPSSYREARKMIDPYLVKIIVFSVCPNDCIIYRNSEKYSFAELTTCPVCDEARYFNKDAKRPMSKRKYSYIPVGPGLARLYGETNLAQLVQAHPGSEYELDKGLDMWDIHDSPMWKEIYSENGFFHCDKMGLSLAFEMDGANPFHNVGIIYSMTPIMLTILNLPRHISNAFGNILLVGIIPGRGRSEASNLDPYIEILVDELIFLSGCTAYSEYSNAPVDVKIKLLLYVLDYPGLSKVFNQQGSGGLSGCHWCHVRGIHCPHLDKVVYLHNRSFLKNDDTMRDDVSNFRDKCEDRTCAIKLRSSKSENEYRTAYEHAKNKTHASTLAAATGCKGTYTLSRLPGHKRHQESQPDACHKIKDVVQNIVHLITGKNVNIPKIIAAETAYDRFSNDIPVNKPSADGKKVSPHH